MLVTFTGKGRAQVTYQGKPYIFSPTRDIPEKMGLYLTTNPETKSSFSVAGETPPSEDVTVEYICDDCKQVCKTQAGLSAHKRKHKEHA